MCRLFGIIADSPVSVEDPILKGKKTFVDLSREHKDGWGLAYVEHRLGGSLHTAKSSVPAFEDERFKETVGGIVSPLVIIHLRDAKYGEVATRNSHPFIGDGWVFAHNGSIERFREIEPEVGPIEYEGETDSERYFHLILKHIKDLGDPVRGMVSAIHWLEDNGLEGGKNFLMTDGLRLYAYRYGRDLLYAERTVLHFSGYELDKLVRAEGGSVSQNPRAVVIASESLTDEDWFEVSSGRLMVIDENLMVSTIAVTDKVHEEKTSEATTTVSKRNLRLNIDLA